MSPSGDSEYQSFTDEQIANEEEEESVEGSLDRISEQQQDENRRRLLDLYFSSLGLDERNYRALPYDLGLPTPVATTNRSIRLTTLRTRNTLSLPFIPSQQSQEATSLPRNLTLRHQQTNAAHTARPYEQHRPRRFSSPAINRLSLQSCVAVVGVRIPVAPLHLSQRPASDRPSFDSLPTTIPSRQTYVSSSSQSHHQGNDCSQSLATSTDGDSHINSCVALSSAAASEQFSRSQHNMITLSRSRPRASILAPASALAEQHGLIDDSLRAARHHHMVDRMPPHQLRNFNRYQRREFLLQTGTRPLSRLEPSCTVSGPRIVSYRDLQRRSAYDAHQDRKRRRQWTRELDGIGISHILAESADVRRETMIREHRQAQLARAHEQQQRQIEESTRFAFMQAGGMDAAMKQVLGGMQRQINRSLQ